MTVPILLVKVKESIVNTDCANAGSLKSEFRQLGSSLKCLLILMDDLQETPEQHHNKTSSLIPILTTILYTLEEIRKVYQSAQNRNRRLELFLFSRTYRTMLINSGLELYGSVAAVQGSGIDFADQTLESLSIARRSLHELTNFLIDKNSDRSKNVEMWCSELETQAGYDLLYAHQVVDSSQDYSRQVQELQGRLKQSQDFDGLKNFAEAPLVKMVDKLRGSVDPRLDNEDQTAAIQSKPSQDFLICPISQDLMRDPVLLVQSGQTYDKEYLCQSLLKFPYLDPSSGVRYQEQMVMAENVVVRSILMDQCGIEAYQKYVYPGDFRRDYVEAWTKQRESKEFLDATPQPIPTAPLSMAVTEESRRPLPHPSAPAETLNVSDQPRLHSAYEFIGDLLFGNHRKEINVVRALSYARQELDNRRGKASILYSIMGWIYHPQSKMLPLIDPEVKSQYNSDACFCQVIYSELINDDTPWALLARGLYHQFSRGEVAEAVEFYRGAATQNLAEAQFILGTLYFFGNGVEEDTPASKQWLKLSADKGNASALCFLGGMYADGQGGLHDVPLAITYYRNGAVQGDSTSQYRLGYIYRHGEGVTANQNSARSYFQRAANQGNADAIEALNQI